MNSAERVMAALSGARPDRTPWTAVLSLYGARLTDCPLERYYHDPGAYAAGQRAVRDTFHPDILFMPFALVKEGEAFGATAHTFANQPPNLDRPALAGEEFTACHLPDIDIHPSLLYLRESLRRTVADNGTTLPVAALALDPFALPVMLFGLERWLEIFLCEVPLRRDVLAMTSAHFVRWANALLADGAACVILPSIFTSPAVLPRTLVEQHVVPVLQQALSQVKGPVIIHHAGGPMHPFLDLLAPLPAAAFAVDARDPLAACRAAVGPERPLLSGIDGPSLADRAPSEIAMSARARCTELTDTRFIFTTTGPDVPYATAPGNLHALAGVFADG